VPSSPIVLPGAAEPEVSIVVLLDGSAAMAERCLRAIGAADDRSIACETVLVLNRPGPELEALVRDGTTGARLIVTRANAGAAVGWNLALDVARGARVAVLHEDAEPDAGWLRPLVAALAEHGAGVVGSRLFYGDGRLQSCGWVLCSDGTPLMLDEASAPEAAAAHEPTMADMVSGAAMLIDRDVLRAAGGFDERFHPAVYSDVDICIAAWRQGRPVLSVPTSTARHEAGALDRREDPVLTGPGLRWFLYARNRDRFLAKWGATVRARVAPPVDGTPHAKQATVAAALARLREPVAENGSPPVASREFTATAGLVQADDGTYGLPSEVEARLDAAEEELIREYCAWLAARDATNERELGELRAHIAWRDHELTASRDRVVELERDLAVARDRAAAADAELVALRRDAHTLHLILGGRWWRLRERLRRALRR
jgi:GT2 family glycosyltransferase